MIELAEPKATLARYLQVAREALLWKLEGLSEYDARRPLTPTGTNVLGVVKHVASVELGYLGDCFDRPSGIPLPWFADDAEPNADMWATPQESREQIVDLYHRAWVHDDATIVELPLDAVGTVPWWKPETRAVTLHQILVHVVAETHRHAGQVDVVRELVDGAVGLRLGSENLPPDVDVAWWDAYRGRLQAVAEGFR
ncbi:MAG: DinB family protein [Sporichthyaceae bacterium]